MSFIKKGKIDDFKDVLGKIVDIRLFLLSKFEYKNLLKLETEEVEEFIGEVRKNLGKHWSILNNYLSLSLKERENIESLSSCNLPSVRLDILLKLSSLDDDEKNLYKNKINALSKDLMYILDLKHLISFLQKDYFGQVEISAYHIYEAVRSMTLRLTLRTETKALAYLKTWLRAQGNWESIQQVEGRKYASQQFSIVSLNAENLLEQEYGELYGSEEKGYDSIEIAEREFALSEYLLDKLYDDASFVDISKKYNEIKEAFVKEQSYNEVHRIYDEIIDTIRKISRTSPEKYVKLFEDLHREMSL